MSEVRCVCVSYSLPPLVFIGGSHQPQHPKPTYRSNREAPCGKVEVVGPMGLGGRPVLAANRPQLLGVGLS